MSIRTEDELAALKRIGRIVADCLRFMGSKLEPGMTTRELDDLGRDFLLDHGARSAPELVYEFPGATCISVNHEVAHGIPGERRIQAGDLVNIDVSAELDGFFGDTGGSFIVPPETKIKRRLCDATRRALDAAIRQATAGAPVNRIGKTIESEARAGGYTVIRNLGSHGVGRALHEEPKFIAGFYDPKDKRILKDGMVITIEPFLSTGASYVEDTGDGWTLATSSRYFSAQYEHSMVITKGQPIILTLPS
ncbi:MAG: type I methionyl aminopeptidase [Bdellovibrionaceae bacterium]|nr:type I methionyl aminopeptidase [Pseudobdellovibrionaceae bacterium]